MATVSIYSSGDANIRNTEINQNFGGETFMPLGRMSGAQFDRMLIGFDFSSLNNKIIDGATLYLYQYYSEYCYTNTLNFNARCITGAWSESQVTYANRPAVSTTAQASLSLSGNSSGLRSFNITGLVKDIVEMDRLCCGIMLIQTDESLTSRRKQFFTEEYGGGSRRPYINITYHEMPVMAVIDKGGSAKQALCMKIVVTKGGEFKNVTGMKVVAEKGGPFKNVF